MLYADETITLFNRYMEGNTEKWTYTVISPASWHMSATAAITPAGMQYGGHTVIRIMEDAETEGKAYVPHDLWEAADKEKAWTLKGGDKIACGAYAFTPQCAADLREIPKLITVMEWADNRRGFNLRHWKAVGQ